MKTYRWNYGELVLGGGIDVEVTAASPEEARAKAEKALDDLRVYLSESQTLDGVRLSYSAAKSEVFLGVPSDQPSDRRARRAHEYSVKSGDEDCMARVAEAAKLAVSEHCRRNLGDDRWDGVDSWELVEGGGI